MKNFKVNFAESERDAVVKILSRSNDIVLNQIEPQSAFITIQLEDEEADALYADLVDQIDAELRKPQVVVIVTQEIVTNDPTV
jgi:hypothetical protein